MRPRAPNPPVRRRRPAAGPADHPGWSRWTTRPWSSRAADRPAPATAATPRIFAGTTSQTLASARIARSRGESDSPSKTARMPRGSRPSRLPKGPGAAGDAASIRYPTSSSRSKVSHDHSASAMARTRKLIGRACTLRRIRAVSCLVSATYGDSAEGLLPDHAPSTSSRRRDELPGHGLRIGLIKIYDTTSCRLDESRVSCKDTVLVLGDRGRLVGLSRRGAGASLSTGHGAAWLMCVATRMAPQGSHGGVHPPWHRGGRC